MDPTTQQHQEPQESVSDLAVAAQYADAELHSVTAQFASAASVSAAPKAPMVAVVMDDNDDSDSDSSDDEAPANDAEADKQEKKKDEASADGSGDDDEHPVKLRTEIEAAMEKEANKTDGPLTTENEVLSAPVREPSVELTADCPIAQCGSILNVSVPGLMMTVKSDPNSKPLDEGSVLCLEDRTVVGCVDEVFGPVLMPMYLVRFEKADKMPEKAAVNVPVYYATEHTTYIVPENIKDKGTDASNIFDEEADEADFSDDEAEAAAKRGNRKRNRGDAPSSGNEGSRYAPSTGRDCGPGGRGGRGGRGSRGRNFSDYNTRPSPSPHGGRGGYAQQPLMPAIPPMQTQPFGGVTKYTQPGGFGGTMPVQYGNTNYTSPRGTPMPQPPYNGMGQAPAPGYYQPPPPPAQYNAHNLPPYPPQAPPPQTPYQPYQQQPRTPYTQPPPPAAYGQVQPPYGHPYAPPRAAYGQPQPPRYQPQHGVPPPPPPPPPANGYYGVNGQPHQQQPRGPHGQ